ncbi:MAG: 4-(cytidine 5'-diphospho)-2-C-methyl-D-erythritol kinase [Oscillospiraceae bacterium]|jgi:4-diphosphocytidyl-2-C-methyl-D-erythritol kinase|nr:4-(cytidine 5'-diphospho)-2-C-methyl-D-erythritol kinase [Oscillospiraceae bacterium]
MDELFTKERAEAKINLYLDVIGDMPNGYHEIISVMQSVSLADEVTVRLVQGSGAEAEAVTYAPGLPQGDGNTATRAALAFFSSAGIDGYRAEIGIEKHIPAEAGLGGGSSDAAAVLRALNRLTGAKLSDDKLREIALTVGSDVPFCVSGGTALARGRGEILEALPPFPAHFCVIVKPAFSISTREMYKEIDKLRPCGGGDIGGLVPAIESGGKHAAASRVYNVFEDVLPQNFRAEILGIKSRLTDSGALAAAMTGTGSAVFALFESEDGAAAARAALPGAYKSCFVAELTSGAS